MSSIVKKLCKGKRMAIIYSNLAVFFWYDGSPDFEWKKGSGGVACDTCSTYQSAYAKAKRYVNKEMTK